MSIYIDDLRNVACMSGFNVCDLAADDIEAMQLEIADHEKAYELLFKENASKDAEIAALKFVVNNLTKHEVRFGTDEQRMAALKISTGQSGAARINTLSDQVEHWSGKFTALRDSKEAEIAALKALLGRIEAELIHAEINDMRLTPAFGKVIGRPAVPLANIRAAMTPKTMSYQPKGV